MADTIVTTDVVTEMNLTVLGKADHENNNDDDDTNDAYVTDLSFALKVEPSGDEDESMKVTLIAGGKTIVGRICGAKESEDEVDLVLEDGNYWFRNVVLTEEDGQTITLNLEGVQNLQQGVYLYSSEVRGGTSSQTLVGMASGERGFDVTVNLSFELDVEGVVVTERVWRDEYDPSNPPVTPPTPPTNPPQRRTWNPPAVNRLANDDVVINEEPVPLASPAITGDSTGLWVAMFLTVAFAMVAVNLFDKKRQHEAF